MKRFYIIGVLILLLVLSGCASDEEKLVKAEVKAYNVELKFCKESIKSITKYIADIEKNETDSSLKAVTKLEEEFDQIEQRYSSSDFNKMVPSEEATIFIDKNLEAATAGESAIDHLNKFYNQEESSSKQSSAEWDAFKSEISNVYSDFKIASEQLDTIRETLEKARAKE